MLNTLVRFLLVSTSLSPLLGAVAVNQFARGLPVTRWVAWLAAALLLVFLCWALLRYASKNTQQHQVHIKEFERNDKEVLAFLVHRFCPWDLIEDIAVIDAGMKGRVETVLDDYVADARRTVTVRRNWYYH